MKFKQGDIIKSSSNDIGFILEIKKIANDYNYKIYWLFVKYNYNVWKRGKIIYFSTFQVDENYHKI
jgi:hypothetical protein